MKKVDIDQLPSGTVVFDESDEELGTVRPVQSGGVKSKIIWDNGCVTIVINDESVRTVRVSERGKP